MKTTMISQPESAEGFRIFCPAAGRKGGGGRTGCLLMDMQPYRVPIKTPPPKKILLAEGNYGNTLDTPAFLRYDNNTTYGVDRNKKHNI